jgi:hypothetical protein
MRLRFVSVFSAWLAVLTIHGAAVAQVARQGTPVTPTDPNAFTSPMVLEASFAAADRSIWGDKSWHEGPDYKALGKYTCDGVALRGDTDKKTKEVGTGLAMRAREISGGKLEVTIGLWLFNPAHNHDKLVIILVDVLDGADVVARTTLGPIEVEDKGHTQARSFPFVMPAAVIKNDAMRMRLTMTTKDD